MAGGRALGGRAPRLVVPRGSPVAPPALPRHLPSSVVAGCVLFAALLAGGCGFQLRTWDLAGLERVRVVASDAPVLRRELERALGQAGVMVAEPGGEDMVVRLSDERESRRTASVTGGARVAEYEMALSVSFGVQNAEGGEMIPTRTLRAERTYRLDIDNLVGSREEEALIVRELRIDLVQRMVRSIGRAAESVRDAATATRASAACV